MGNGSLVEQDWLDLKWSWGWIWNSGVGVGIGVEISGVGIGVGVETSGVGVGVDILELCRSWSWSWNSRSWSWSWYSGDWPELELELKPLELELELSWYYGVDPNPGHKSTYITFFLTWHNESINDDKTTIFTHRPCVSHTRFSFCWWCHNRMLMTSQWPDNCDVITRIIISNSLDIDFINDDIQGRSCKNVNYTPGNSS